MLVLVLSERDAGVFSLTEGNRGGVNGVNHKFAHFLFHLVLVCVKRPCAGSRQLLCHNQQNSDPL